MDEDRALADRLRAEEQAAAERDREMAHRLQVEYEGDIAAITADAEIARQLSDEGFKCPICLEDWSIQNVVELGQCRHRQCRDCIRELIYAELESNHWPIVCSLCKAGADGDAAEPKAYGGKLSRTIRHFSSECNKYRNYSAYHRCCRP
jgi:hypothetical protein